MPLTTRRKALTINLDEKRYGTFAEIGAGQEVARHFFQVGGAAGTIANSISAYDMAFSDATYGKAKRYVSRERLCQMLEHEYELLEERLAQTKAEKSNFFVYANTVAARSFAGNNECHGWMGVRFQTHYKKSPSEILVHVRMLDKTNIAQQEALGVFGVNLLYGAFYLADDPDAFIASLADNLEPQQIEVDMIEFNGPAFEHVENRILSLKLIEHQLTHAVMFDAHQHVLQPSEALRHKCLLLQRGSFKPITHVNVDMLQGSQRQFLEEPYVKDKEVLVLLEITINKLQESGKLDYQDFLARVDAAASLGHPVLVSDYFEFYRLTSYLRRYTPEMIGLVMGINTLLQIFEEQHYKNLEGGVLEACGRLFKDKIRAYAYPMRGKGYQKYTQLRGIALSAEVDNSLDSDELITAETLIVKDHLRGLYSYLKRNKLVCGMHYFNPDYLEIFAPEVFKMIQSRQDGWQRFVPEPVAKAIEASPFWCNSN